MLGSTLAAWLGFALGLIAPAPIAVLGAALYSGGTYFITPSTRTTTPFTSAFSGCSLFRHFPMVGRLGLRPEYLRNPSRLRARLAAAHRWADRCHAFEPTPASVASQVGIWPGGYSGPSPGEPFAGYSCRQRRMTTPSVGRIRPTGRRSTRGALAGCSLRILSSIRTTTVRRHARRPQRFGSAYIPLTAGHSPPPLSRYWIRRRGPSNL